jgi:release factor glutamine methyltransferase
MTNKPQALSAVLYRTQDALAQAGIDNPSLDTRLLVAHALGCEHVDLALEPERILTPEEIAKIDALIARRAKREPVARILGLREFWGLSFALNEATLEPRPDTEALVEVVLKSRAPSLGPRTPTFLDIGTGTGCLLLALLHELPEATGLGIDIAPRAVQQARHNAGRLGLTTRASFRVNYWLEALGEMFDIIVCNPPYVASADIPSLMPEVRDHDPHEALDGGADGLDVYRFLIPQLPYFLNPSGLAVFEIGQGQAEAVTALFRTAGFTKTSVHKDLAGIERCIAAQR